MAVGPGSDNEKIFACWEGLWVNPYAQHCVEMTWYLVVPSKQTDLPPAPPKK